MEIVNNFDIEDAKKHIIEYLSNNELTNHYVSKYDSRIKLIINILSLIICYPLSLFIMNNLLKTTIEYTKFWQIILIIDTYIISYCILYLLIYSPIYRYNNIKIDKQHHIECEQLINKAKTLNDICEIINQLNYRHSKCIQPSEIEIEDLLMLKQNIESYKFIKDINILKIEESDKYSLMIKYSDKIGDVHKIGLHVDKKYNIKIDNIELIYTNWTSPLLLMPYVND